MCPEKLPADAFDFYFALGTKRSYQAVADRYGVSKRTVAARAARENWTDRTTKLALAISEAPMPRRESKSAAVQKAITEVMTPQRVKALFAALFRSAIQNEDVAASRLLLERILGKPRAEPLAADAIDIPDGLESTAAVVRAANALLQGVADGSLAPEDAQRVASVVEAARRSIETEELDRRLHAVEETLLAEKKR